MNNCSVIVAQYNPDLKKVYRTLKSILAQKNVKIQIIISDDGSENNHFTEIDMFLQKTGFSDYCFCKNSINKGTVINVLNAVKKARYNYLSFLAPGDLYYDDSTVQEIIDIMINKDLSFSFGKVAAYNTKQNEINTFNIQQPHYLQPYIKYNSKKENKTIARNLVVFRDYIAGASFYWEKALFEDYLLSIENKVIYMEDLVSIFAVLDGAKMCFIDRYVVWYEYGDGVSTSHTQKWRTRLNCDLNAFYTILKTRYPRSRIVKRACMLQKFENMGSNKSKLFQLFLFPDRVLYVIIHYKLLKEKVEKPDIEKIRKAFCFND